MTIDTSQFIEFMQKIDDYVELPDACGYASAAQCFISCAIHWNNFSHELNEHEVCIQLDMRCIKFITSPDIIDVLANEAYKMILLYSNMPLRTQYLDAMNELKSYMHRLCSMMRR